MHGPARCDVSVQFVHAIICIARTVVSKEKCVVNIQIDSAAPYEEIEDVVV